ncbi:transmembrane amino acid transporter protein-domain-containing protein [Aspergillus aurantiobrunneus]
MSLKEAHSVSQKWASTDQSDDASNNMEVFAQSEGQVDFRTVHWLRAGVIFLKLIFATGVLSIPSLMYELGAVPGALIVVGWGVLNTYCAIIQGDFQRKHPQCHTVVDMAYILGGPALKEVVGLLFTIGFVIVAASGIIGVSTAFNALSLHAVCTVWFTLAATAVVTIFASLRTFAHIGWATWVGFASLYVAVLIIVIASTLQSRPAAAPPVGEFDLGFRAIGDPDFISGITACVTIFVSSAGTSAFIPVLAEMRKPQDYRKSVYLSMGLSTASYVTFALVIYAWCGKWIASPALGTAGGLVKRISYGIALPGLIMSGSLFVHVAAKYVFVRILRNSRHLQSNTIVHWGTWLGCTISISVISFVLASAIPIFNYIIGLVGSICFSLLALSLPGCLWLSSNSHYRRGSCSERVLYLLHILLVLLGAFMAVGGTYGTVMQIKEAYASGMISSAFSCADNSNS